MLAVVLAAREQRALVASIVLAVVLLLAATIAAGLAEHDLPDAPPPVVDLTEQGAPWLVAAEPTYPADYRNAGRHARSRGVRHA